MSVRSLCPAPPGPRGSARGRPGGGSQRATSFAAYPSEASEQSPSLCSADQLTASHTGSSVQRPQQRSRSAGWREFKRSVAGLHNRVAPLLQEPAEPTTVAAAAAVAAAAPPPTPPPPSESLMSSAALRAACPTPDSAGFRAPKPETGDPIKSYRSRKPVLCEKRERALKWYYRWESRLGASRERRKGKPKEQGAPEVHALGQSTLPRSALNQHPYCEQPAAPLPNTPRIQKTSKKRREITPKITQGAIRRPHYLVPRPHTEVEVFAENATADTVRANATAVAGLQDLLRLYREHVGERGRAVEV